MAAEEVLHQGQFGTTFNRETPAPGQGFFGTNHPIDIALGRARRLGHYAAAAKGSSPGDTLQRAQALLSGAHPNLLGGTE